MSRYRSNRGPRSYAKMGMVTEDETGWTDDDGRVLKKTGLCPGEETG